MKNHIHCIDTYVCNRECKSDPYSNTTFVPHNCAVLRFLSFSHSHKPLFSPAHTSLFIISMWMSPSLLRYYWTMVGDPRGDLVEASVQLLCLVLDYYPHNQVNRLQTASQTQQAPPEPGAGNLFCGYVSRLHQNEVGSSLPSPCLSHSFPSSLILPLLYPSPYLLIHIPLPFRTWSLLPRG